MLLLALSLLDPARAGSLDLLEVGGVWGTPGATNPTALWWNPAGMAVGGGTQFLVEGAPVLAQVQFDRVSPDYGPAEETTGNGEVNPLDVPYDYGGQETIRFNGVVPFLGVQSDFGVDGLAVGAGLYVPFALGGRVGDAPPTFEELQQGKASALDYPQSPGSFFLRDGSIQAIYTSLGASYQVADVVAFGVSGSMVDSTWHAVLDVETLSTLENSAGALADYSSAEQLFESPDYRSTLTFNHLKDRAFTFGVGTYLTPVDGLGISVAYNHGMRLDHQGDVMVATACPPEQDVIGRIGVELLGLCNANTPGRATVGYRLPSRIHGGVVVDAIDRLRMEAMGGWVGWSVFTDYEIQTRVDPKDVPDAESPEAAAELISQDRKWARDNRDSFWLGADVKGEAVPDTLTVGGRVIFDKAAIPDAVLATNNYDADRVIVGGMAAVGPFGPVRIAASVGHHFLAHREVKDSAFAVTLAEQRNPDRYYYPSAAGTYDGRITRFGISVLGHFGKPSDDVAPL